MSKQVGKGAAYLYIESTISLVSGYIFWLIISKITTPEIIGISSALISLTTILVSIVSMGIPTGLQRFLGKCFSDKQLGHARVFIKASLILVSIGILASAVLMIFLKDWFQATFIADVNLLGVAITLVACTVIATLFRSVIIASLNTRILSVIMSIASTAKLALAVLFVLLGTGALGLTIGFTVNQVIASIALGLVVVTIVRSSGNLGGNTLWKASKDILTASAASWFPAMVTSVGLQLGTIVVYGSLGANNAGIYFIAFSIMTAITGLMYSIFSIAYPVLSGMTDGRKKLLWKVTKMSLIISLPLSSSFIFYSEDVMRLLGQEYVEGAQSLEILLLSMLPIIILNGVSILVYAYGYYRHVLQIGLASSIPRTVLYFVLVPAYGSVGAAFSFTIGSVIGFVIAILIARKIRLHLFWRDIAIIFGVPMGLAFIQSYLQANYIVGILLTLVISYLLLLKLRVLKLIDIRDSISILPPPLSNHIGRVLTMIEKRLRLS